MSNFLDEYLENEISPQQTDFRFVLSASKSTCVPKIMKIGDGIIYFVMGTKNPKIIVDDHDFLIYRKEAMQTVWYCSHYFNNRVVRCKCKIFTTGKKVTIYGQHVHEPKFNKDKYKNMMSQSVYIERLPAQ